MSVHTETGYIQPLNGAFTIVTYSNHILLFKGRGKNHFELPGGGEEEEDEGSLEKTAIREALEEVKVRLRTSRIIEVGDFIQRFKGRNNEGKVKLFQAQAFLFPESSIGADYFIYKGKKSPTNTEKEFEMSDEAEIIRFMHISKIFDGSIEVNLAHKRMILHWLNWCEKAVKAEGRVMQGRLADAVTALVPQEHNSNEVKKTTAPIQYTL